MATQFDQTKKRSNSVALFSISDGRLVWDYGPGLGKLTLDPADVSAENRARAMMFGLKQRVSDAAALSRDTDSGKSASPEEKFEAQRRVIEHLASGSTEWSIRAPAEGGGANASYVSRALVEIGKAADVVAANELVKRLADRDHGGKMGPARAALAKAQDISTAIVTIKAREAAAQAVGNSDDLLGELMD